MNLIYTAVKKQITNGNYEQRDMMKKLDVFLLCDRIDIDQYQELIGLMQPEVAE